ncbi:MAG: asparagine synthetase B family protein [Thermoanaerobaculia bacterium]
MGHRAEAGIEYQIEGSTGLATLRMRPTPFARLDPPVSEPANTPRVVFDGRIDNRSVLLGRLGARAGDYSRDGHLLAALFARFGERILPDLLGDFALAVWDPRERTLLLARDVSGVRPLCYYDDGSTIYFASEVSAFFSLPSFRQIVNDRKVAQYLVATMHDRDETVYRGVMRVPPANVLAASDRSTLVRRYFDYDLASTLRYRTDREYAEHFLELFRESLAARLPEGELCGAELSGGLDSSSIVCTAAMLGRSIEAFSLVFPGCDCDESEYIDLVARHAGVVSHRINPSPRTRNELYEEIDRIRDVPDEPNGAMHTGGYRLAKSLGIRTLLSGVGGDDLFDSAWNRAAAMEALASGEVRRWSRDFNLVDLCLGGRDLLARSWIGPAVRPILRRFRPARLLSAPWIGHDLIALASREAESPRVTNGVRTITRFATYDAAMAPWLQFALEGGERSAARTGIELAFPFLDRRLAQFAISIPQEQRSKLRIQRYVVREAMRGILPEAIRTRSTKAEFGGAFDRELQVVIDSHPQLSVLDRWVDATVLDAELRRCLATLRGRGVATPWQWQLWEAVAISAWFNRLFAEVA